METINAIASSTSWEVWQRQQDERNGVIAPKRFVPKVKAPAEKPAYFVRDERHTGLRADKALR